MIICTLDIHGRRMAIMDAGVFQTPFSTNLGQSNYLNHSINRPLGRSVAIPLPG